MYSFTWAGNFKKAVVWYPHAVAVLKRLLVLGVAAHSETPIAGVSIMLRTSPPHVHIVALTGLFLIRSETPQVDESKHHHSGYTGIRRFEGNDGDKLAVTRFGLYGFYETQIRDVSDRLSGFQDFADGRNASSEYFSNKSFFVQFSGRGELGFSAYSSDFSISMLDGALKVVSSMVLKHQERVTQRYAEKGWFNRGYDAFDYALTGSSPSGEFVAGNYLSRNSPLHGYTEAYNTASAIVKMRGDTVARAISFDMANNYDYDLRVTPGGAKRADPSLIFKSISQGPDDVLAFWVSDSWVECIAEDDDYIYIGGAFMGMCEYGVKGGELFSFVEIEQDISKTYLDDPHGHNLSGRPYKYRGKNLAGVEVEVVGGEIRPRIGGGRRDHPSLSVSLKTEHTGVDCHSPASSGLHSGFLSGYSGGGQLTYFVNDQLGSIVKLTKDLEVVEARNILSDKLNEDSEFNIINGATQAIILSGGSLFQFMENGVAGEFVPTEPQPDIRNPKFSAIAKWNTSLTELQSYKILGKNVSLQIHDAVLHTNGLMYVVGSVVRDGSINAAAFAVDNSLGIVKSKVYFLGNSEKTPGHSSIFRSLFESITITAKTGQTVATCVGIGYNGEYNGALLLQVDIESLDVVGSVISWGYNFAQLTSVVTTDTDTVAVGTAFDSVTGAGASLLSVGNDVSALPKGKVTGLESSGVVPVTVLAEAIGISEITTGLAGLCTTDYMREVTQDETFTAEQVDHTNVGGEFS